MRLCGTDLVFKKATHSIKVLDHVIVLNSSTFIKFLSTEFFLVLHQKDVSSAKQKNNPLNTQYFFFTQNHFDSCQKLTE